MRKLSLLKKWDSLSPYRKLIFGFLVAIFVGVILLKLPFSLRENQNITVLDSLFTAFRYRFFLHCRFYP